MFARGGHGISRSIASLCRVYSTSPTPPAVAGSSQASRTTLDNDPDSNPEKSSRSTVSLEQLQDQYDLFSHADVFRVTFNKSDSSRTVRQRNRGIIERIVKAHFPDIENEAVHLGDQLDAETIDISKDELLAEIIHAQIKACITPEDLTRVITKAAKLPQGLQALAEPKMQTWISDLSSRYHHSLRTLIALNHLIRHLETAELPVVSSIYRSAACAAAVGRNLTALKINLQKLVATLARDEQILGPRRTRKLLHALRMGFKNASEREYLAVRQILTPNSDGDGIFPLLKESIGPSIYAEYIATLGVLRMTHELAQEWQNWLTEDDKTSLAYRAKKERLNHPPYVARDAKQANKTQGHIKTALFEETLFIRAFFDAQQPLQAWEALHLVASQDISASNPTPRISNDKPSTSPEHTETDTANNDTSFIQALSNAPEDLWQHLFATSNLLPPTLPRNTATLLKSRFLEMLHSELEALEEKLGIKWTPASPTDGNDDGSVQGKHSRLKQYTLIRNFAPEYRDD